MNIDDAGARFIIGFEGTVTRNGRHVLYDDGGRGQGNCTIGIGHLVHEGPTNGDPREAPFAGGITDNEAFRLFLIDVASRVASVNRWATRPLNQNETNALVDWVYNCGGHPSVYPAIWRAVNAKQDINAILTTAITGAGITNPTIAAQVTAALKRRRLAEYNLFHTPDPEEDDMAERVWCAERAQTWIVGKHGAAPVAYPVDDAIWEALYGGHTKVMSAADLEKLRVPK